MTEIAATLGFAAGVIVGLVIAQLREASISARLAEPSPNSEVFTNHETRDTKHGLYGASLEETSPSSKVFTNHESRDTAFFRITAFRRFS